MKFYELVYLFKSQIQKVKSDNAENPSGRYIILAYNNILRKLDSEFSENETVTDKKINNMEITDNMKQKLIGISKQKISIALEKKIKDYKTIHKLKRELDMLLGIGSRKADELIADGLKSIKQLENKKWFDKLNQDTQITLQHKPNRELKWADVAKLEDVLTNFEDRVTLVGSFIRKKPIMKDIDILFLSSKSSDLKRYVEYLKKQFGGKLWFYEQGPDRSSFVFTSNNKKWGTGTFKADIFVCTRENFYSMLLYSTGSRDHNIKMRAKAKKLGYLLNQDGIFRGNKKINKSSDDEKKLFEILEMAYVPPAKRF